MPWEPLRHESFYTLQSLEMRVEFMKQHIAAGSAIYLLSFKKDDGQLIGDCNFTNIVRGPFQACHLGFSIAHDREGQGLCVNASTPASDMCSSGLSFTA
jgi:[ribosomal protein S5]-alanine N-acetyltransferase